MAQGRKTGGRKPGSKNKRTLGREALMQQAARVLESELGEKAFKGDAHALLMAIYKNGELPIELRADAAKAAVRYEKPALASTDTTITDRTQYHVALPDGSVDMKKWRETYAPNPHEDDDNKELH